MCADKPGLPTEQLEWLNEGVRQLGLEISGDALHAITRHLSLVRKWRSRMSLVSIVSERELISHHALDSLALLPFVEDSRAVLDFGTGAGFPGIPLAAAKPEIEFVLLDSRQRRIEFIRMVNAQLKLENVSLVNCRVEEFALPKQSMELSQSEVQMTVKFDTLVARAVASLEQLVSMTAPVRIDGQRLVAMKGRYPHEELEELEANCTDQIVSVRVEPLRVPFLDAQRHAVIVQF